MGHSNHSKTPKIPPFYGFRGVPEKSFEFFLNSGFLALRPLILTLGQKRVILGIGNLGKNFKNGRKWIFQKSGKYKLVLLGIEKTLKI